MKTSRAKLAAAVLPVAFAATSLVAAPAATAGETGALACQHPGWSNKDSATGRISGSTAPLREGVNAECSNLRTVVGGDTIYYHCYAVNSAGNTWTHVRVRSQGADYYGWIYDGNLANGGSTKHC
ncbi:SH3 domain-containing protein [Streptomyces sp. NPDC049879]|uniref:SH3 domain-containing protein n=1 Tax=Streptomyces sp. NPDC049879 TaxID=3365598 RepID=UPI0037A1A24C